MLFKGDIVERKLARLDHALSTLGLLKKRLTLKDLLGNTEEQWKVERGLQIACQCVLDIGDHILSTKFATQTDEYEQVIEDLKKHDVLPSSLAERLEGLAGFRNIIVHSYDEIDLEILYDKLQHGLKDFEEFVKVVLEYMKEHQL